MVRLWERASQRKPKTSPKPWKTNKTDLKKTKRLYFETLWRGPQTENKKLEQKKVF